MKRDLTEGSAVKNLVVLSLPAMIGFIFQTMYDLINMAWMGRIGSNAIAGAAIFTSIMGLVIVLNEIIGSSSIPLISRAYGEGDKERTQKVAEQTIVFKVFVALIASSLLFFGLQPLLTFFTDVQVVKQQAFDYGSIRLLFLPIAFASYSVNTIFRCTGDTKTPMILMGVTSFINIVLDPFLMFETVPIIGVSGLGLGVKGAAFATGICVVISLLVGIGILLSGKAHVKISVKGLFKLDKELSKKLILIGLPSGLEGMMRSLCNFIALKMISVFGVAAVAAMGIGNTIIGFVIMPLVGFAMGGNIIVGQSLGVEDYQRASDTAKINAKICVGITGVFSIIALVFPTAIMSFFTEDQAVIDIGVVMVRCIVPALMGVGITFGIGVVFAGSGYNVPFFVASTIARWCVQLPLMIILIYVAHTTISWVWLAFIVSEMVEAVLMLLYYRQGKWKKVRV